MIQFKYYNEGATFDASSLNNDDIAFVEDENALYTHGRKFKFVDEVTPSPTPTPKARLARFILANYGLQGEVQVLTDTHGRILTQYTQDGDYRTACVYVPGGNRIDWDTASDQELVTLLSKYGYNDALTIENNNVSIDANGETETLTWDSAAMDFTIEVDMFQNGAQNMYFRTVYDGSQDVRVLCDANGKAIQAPTLGEYTNVLFTVDYYGAKIGTITDDDTFSREGIINACGGAVNVTVLDAGESVFLLVLGTHIQYCNADDTTTTPSVTDYTETLFPLKWRNVSWFRYKVLVNSKGEVLIDGSDLIIETGNDTQNIRVNVAQNGINVMPAGTPQDKCVITGQKTALDTGNFTFVYQNQTYNVVDRICTPDITDIYE